MDTFYKVVSKYSAYLAVGGPSVIFLIAYGLKGLRLFLGLFKAKPPAEPAITPPALVQAPSEQPKEDPATVAMLHSVIGHYEAEADATFAKDLVCAMQYAEKQAREVMLAAPILKTAIKKEAEERKVAENVVEEEFVRLVVDDAIKQASDAHNISKGNRPASGQANILPYTRA